MVTCRTGTAVVRQEADNAIRAVNRSIRPEVEIQRVKANDCFAAKNRHRTGSMANCMADIQTSASAPWWIVLRVEGLPTSAGCAGSTSRVSQSPSIPCLRQLEALPYHQFQVTARWSARSGKARTRAGSSLLFFRICRSYEIGMRSTRAIVSSLAGQASAFTISTVNVSLPIGSSPNSRP